MRACIYENLSKLSYGELLQAISNIKDKLQEVNKEDKVYHKMNEYYAALMQEIDKRDRFRWNINYSNDSKSIKNQILSNFTGKITGFFQTHIRTILSPFKPFLCLRDSIIPKLL